MYMCMYMCMYMYMYMYMYVCDTESESRWRELAAGLAHSRRPDLVGRPGRRPRSRQKRAAAASAACRSSVWTVGSASAGRVK